MSNYPAGIGNYFSEQAEWEMAIERAEERIVEEYGDGDLYMIENELCNEETGQEYLIELGIDIENLWKYWISREELTSQMAEENMRECS